ncbi:MAG: sodium:solute symporter family protein, partial [Planctomycetes bacterium]|nr:sodium:solute symporter family protein [Planctomycetota bacterium]
MHILSLHYLIWIVLIVYFAGMLVLGWRSKSRAASHEGYLLGNRKFGTWWLVMHAFGAGTSPADVSGSFSKTVTGGASGIWVSWMWLFGTPFYWVIAPIIRRMRCQTMADMFFERFGKSAAMLYTIIAALGMTMYLCSVQLATVRTIQGMMGQSTLAATGQTDWWFYGILISSTLIFALYGYWGGIVAAVRTDMVQGLMIIVLSVLCILPALHYDGMGGWSEVRQILGDAQTGGKSYLSLFDGNMFSLKNVIVLCLYAPLVALSFPHLMPICGGGRTEWEGRMGFAGGNFLKRVCTIGWSVLALAWLAYLIKSGSDIHPDAAFGDSIRALLPPFLQGVILACVMAAAMSSGDSFQVTVASLFTQTFYAAYKPDASDEEKLRFTKRMGLVLVVAVLCLAIYMQESLVKAILAYFGILGIIGIANGMGILWRRMNTAGVFGTVTLGATAMILTKTAGEAAWLKPLLEFIPGTGWVIILSILGGILGSLGTAPPSPETIERVFSKMHTPIGRDDMLPCRLDQAVPPEARLFTKWGLFIVKPDRQTVIGFLVFSVLCLACIGVMLLLL